MYYYDAAGQLIGFIVNGSTYYYVRNVQGDIIKILDGNMEEVVEYKYDTWGNVIGMEGSDYGKWVGSLNPFRYRGYYYDDESGLYYLQSRYYNPEWSRFINADISLLGNVGASLHNLYAYASNNPVVFSDPAGMGVLYSPGCKTYTTGTEVTNYVITSTGENHYSDRVKAVRKELDNYESIANGESSGQIVYYTEGFNRERTVFDIGIISVVTGTKMVYDYSTKLPYGYSTFTDIVSGANGFKNKANYFGIDSVTSNSFSSNGISKSQSFSKGNHNAGFSMAVGRHFTFTGNESITSGNASKTRYTTVKVDLLPLYCAAGVYVGVAVAGAIGALLPQSTTTYQPGFVY